MSFRRNNINRVVAAILLFTLIFIHGVKLLHNHSFGQFSHAHFTEQTDKLQVAGESPFYFSGDCDICNYQLTKDTDHFIVNTESRSSLSFVVHHAQLIFFQKLSPFSSFENRGPPNNA